MSFSFCVNGISNELNISIDLPLCVPRSAPITFTSFYFKIHFIFIIIKANKMYKKLNN